MRLVRAEFLKVRKRRGLLALAGLLTLAPVAIGLVVISILHAADPAKHDPAGGLENFQSIVQLIAQVGIVAVVLVGATVGAGDRGAGVFRELVSTGRSRTQLFAARVPGGLALVLPMVGAAFAVATVAGVVLAGSDQPAVTAGEVAGAGGWLAASVLSAYLLAVGVSSLLSSRGTAIGVLLAWQLAVAPILLASGKLDGVLPNAALLAFDPADETTVGVSSAGALAVLVAWTLVPLAAGAWRTRTSDA